jgi:nitrogen fixation protein FixH
MKKFYLPVLFLTLALALVACGGSAAPAAPAAQATSQATVKMESNPNPAAVGDVQLIFTITDQSGAPIEGAKVDVSAEHPSMSGMGMKGVATEQGGGKYAIKANFSDKGSWKITVSVHKDGLDVKQELPLEVK